MKFLELAYRLGVVFAIFGFIWGIFQIGLALLRGIRPKTLIEQYILKFLQYLFLVDVTFLFCVNRGAENQALYQEIILAGFILLMYFVGKLQNSQSRIQWLQISAVQMPALKPLFNFTAEIVVISVAIALFVFLIFFPQYAQNPVSEWFYDSILGIEETFFFGFIFKIIGVFMLLSLIVKMINGISFLISGAPLMTVQKQFNVHNENKKKDDFDDFEEVN